MGAYSFLLFNLVVTAMITAVLSFRYGNWKKQNKIVTLVHCLSWWLPALILTTLPVDIATAFYTNCTSTPLAQPADRSQLQIVSPPEQAQPQSKLCRAPWLYADSRILLIFWHTVYWSSQFLTWLVIPIMRSFSTAGDFTTLAKLRTALIDNALYYASYLAIFVTALVYLLVKRAIRLDFGYLKVLVITAANTWGLFLVILFLGYGLVAVPRTLWTAGNPLISLRRAYFTLSKRNMELADEEDKLNELVEEVRQLKSGLPLNHPLQRHLLVVVKQAQEITASPGSLSRPDIRSRMDLSSVPPVHSDPTGLNLKQLTRLHRSLKSTRHRRDRAEALYWESVEHAIWIEDLNTFRSKHRILAFAQAHSGRVVRSISAHIPVLGPVLFRAQAYWYCYVRLWLFRLLAIVLALTSLLMVWSECTFFVRSPTLSLVAGLVKAQARQDDYFLLELSSFLTLGYLSLAVFYSVFRLRLFNYYRLVGSHHTDENSLLFCGALLCRLTPSLCLNFLGLAHLDSHISRTTLNVPVNLMNPANSVNAHDIQSTVIGGTSEAIPHYNVETTYTRFMGHLDVIPFIASGFNIYFPILVVLLCGLTLVRFGDRILHHLGVPQLLDHWIDTDNVDADSPNSLVEDAVQDGRLLLRKERMMLSRKERLTKADNELQTFSHSSSSNSSRSQMEDRVHLLESADSMDRDPSTRLTSGQGSLDAETNFKEENEVDLLPPMRYSNFDRLMQFPIESSQLVEYSEEEIKKQFSLSPN
ncbi:LMBR1 domain-containing protein 2-B [Fasciolopsis buskii]|uniref:LMBR1 domain-containing protein 2-B n=1 Tax=Fasciolopsis buskii TaxID=27845 RepID=A0A8E0RSU0_9TREM|nr:LMBR1 domain-containing protein 2-B [Fasciolopsis buski]